MASGLEEISTVAFTPDANALVAVDFAGRAAFLPLHGEARRLADGGVSAVAFNPAGETVALGADDGTISFGDRSGRRRLGTAVAAHSGPVSSLAFSPDGRTLASGGESDGTVRLWDVARRTPVGTALKVDDAGISSLSFAPDRTTVAVGIRSRSFVLWDLAQRRPVGQPVRIGDYTSIPLAFPNRDLDTSVSFSRDGRTLATKAGPAVVLWKRILWSRDDAPFRERLCHVVGRNLTATEWRTFLPGAPYRKTCSQWPAATR
jgi:WD40 repeat protein